MRIWIDMSNSPHPLLFGPIARRLEDRGHEVLVTTRDHAQTLSLTLERWPDAEVIGGETRPNRARKAALILKRVQKLRSWAREQRPDLAVSHQSYAQILAARSLGIRSITAMDYEHQPINHVAFRAASRIVLPQFFPPKIARRQGASPRKTRRFTGFKEEIYLGDFDPNPATLTELGVAGRRPLIVARTPPSGATYHQFENPAFERLVDRLGSANGGVCVVIPRNAEQRESLRRVGAGLVVPDSAIDSRSLMHAADLFVGAGGTMTREAALLGTPTVSLFAGGRAAADTELARRGLLRIVTSDEEIGPIERRTTEPRSIEELRGRAEEAIVSFLSAALN